MKNVILLTAIWLLSLSSGNIKSGPDLTKKEDLKALGFGKIFETDKTITTRIMLEEVADYYVVYIKNESLHDMAMDRINRIEFYETKWGPVKIEFPNNKPKITLLD